MSASQFVYAGAADSGRIIRLGAPVLTQITSAGSTAPLFDIRTWEHFPVGPGGVAIFRVFTVRFWSDAGYNLRVTPYIDGVALSTQDFSASTTGEVAIKAYIAQRGASASCRVQQLTRLGNFELIDIQVGYFPLRAIP